MQKEIIEIITLNKEKCYRITTTDERWYTIPGQDSKTNLPIWDFIPSVTWITSYVYKGIEFYKWLANKGWDEAEAIKTEAGDKGSRVHHAIEELIKGSKLHMTDKIVCKDSDQPEELGVDEWKAIVSFVSWCEKYKPKFILSETTVISKKHNFAGTVDCVVEIDNQVYIIDFKTSQYIWPSMIAQISAYKEAFKEMGRNVSNAKLAILQLGYKRNKMGYKFTEVEDKFEDLFMPAKKFWENATKGQSPKQIYLPMAVEINSNLAPESESELPKDKVEPKKIGDEIKKKKAKISPKKSNPKKK